MRFREKSVDFVSSRKPSRTQVWGYVLVGLMLLAVYVEFINVVNTAGQPDFVESVSLIDSRGQVGSVFAMGETVTLLAKMRGGNAYRLDIYDENGSVIRESGSIADSEAVVRVLLASEVFRPRHAYSVVFQAGLTNSPLPGMGIYSSSVVAFSVVQSLTKMNFEAVYDETTSSVDLRAVLLTDASVPVLNRTVQFALQPDMDVPDAGWVNVGSAQSDESGTAVFPLAVDMMSGHHGLRARFAGDDDFGSSLNTTSFVVKPKATRLRIVKIEKSGDKVNLLLRVTNKYNFPLAGRLVGFTIGELSLGWLNNWNRSILTSLIYGPSPQQAFLKGTVNYFMGTGIKAALMLGLGLLIFDTPFLVASLALGIYALVLALSIVL